MTISIHALALPYLHTVVVPISFISVMKFVKNFPRRIIRIIRITELCFKLGNYISLSVSVWANTAKTGANLADIALWSRVCPMKILKFG